LTRKQKRKERKEKRRGVSQSVEGIKAVVLGEGWERRGDGAREEWMGGRASSFSSSSSSSIACEKKCLCCL